MAGWAGFTDEDLRKMRQTSPQRAPTARTITTSQNKRPKAPNTNSVPRERAFINNPKFAVIEKELEPSQRLSRPKTKQLPSDGKHSVEESSKVDKKRVDNTTDDKQPDNASDRTKGDNPEDEKKPEINSRELDESEALNVELTTMENFQKQQKMIEEANKQKKALLAKTLEQRRKKAKAESVKLTKIQKELNHLDNLLTADVSVIRDRIETASVEFLDAQKRYDKAEKEVIAAKMNLFEKGELKERLTEHLYTIIHQNEVRKAKKLAELMECLEMEISQEEMELQVTSIPPLTNFNCVHTLTSPTHKHPDSQCESPDKGGNSSDKGGNLSSSPSKGDNLTNTTTVTSSESSEDSTKGNNSTNDNAVLEIKGDNLSSKGENCTAGIAETSAVESMNMNNSCEVNSSGKVEKTVNKGDDSCTGDNNRGPNIIDSTSSLSMTPCK